MLFSKEDQNLADNIVFQLKHDIFPNGLLIFAEDIYDILVRNNLNKINILKLFTFKSTSHNLPNPQGSNWSAYKTTNKVITLTPPPKSPSPTSLSLDLTSCSSQCVLQQLNPTVTRWLTSLSHMCSSCGKHQNLFPKSINIK